MYVLLFPPYIVYTYVIYTNVSCVLFGFFYKKRFVCLCFCLGGESQTGGARSLKHQLWFRSRYGAWIYLLGMWRLFGVAGHVVVALLQERTASVTFSCHCMSAIQKERPWAQTAVGTSVVHRGVKTFALAGLLCGSPVK